jgi:hypothetical protein
VKRSFEVDSGQSSQIIEKASGVIGGYYDLSFVRELDASGFIDKLFQGVTNVIRKPVPYSRAPVCFYDEQNSANLSQLPSQLLLGGFSSIRARQIRFVDLHPVHPAAPVAVGCWFPRWYIVESAGRDNGPLAVARGVRNWTITVAANLPRKTFRLWKIEALDQLFSLGPTKLGDRHRNVRRAYPTRGFTATRAVAMPEPGEGCAHFVAH